MKTLRFTTTKFRSIDIQSLNWRQRLLLSVAGITMLGVGALFFLLMLPLLAVGVGTLLLRKNNAQAGISDLQDYIDAEYTEEKPGIETSENRDNRAQ